MEITGNSTSRREVKLEIEKSELKYRLSRIEGFQGKYKFSSSIGVNSPSGKRLLTDKDLIAKKTKEIENELSVIVKNRFVQRYKKGGKYIPIVAFTGYTNS